MKSMFSMKYYMLFSVLLLTNFLHAETSEEYDGEDVSYDSSSAIKRTPHGLNSPQHLQNHLDKLQSEINSFSSGAGGSSFPTSCSVTTPTNVTVGCTTTTSTTTIQSGTGGVQVTSFLGLPTTTSADVGTIKIGANPVFHSFHSSFNMFVGAGAGNFALTGTGNNALGANALFSLTNGSNNNAIGLNTLSSLADGSKNNGVGSSVLINATSGSSNNAIGFGALGSITTGSNNVAIGDLAGSALTAGNSNNILINNSGVAGDGAVANSGVIRIGNSTKIAKTFIAGIRGVTTGVADAVSVLIDSAGQLGTVSSSIRYKENVEDMDDVSSNILDLRPVTFSYKSDETHTMVPGLIAEEVEAIMKSLVVYNKDGLVESVKYHELPVLLLNELKKSCKRIKELEKYLIALEIEHATVSQRMIDIEAKNATLVQHDEELSKEIDDLKSKVSLLMTTMATFMKMIHK